uniref:Uncharacterized protein n=1 Tax=Arundo donax TaxID=35708 RepID=A0A0A8Z2H2_ARUDO
MWDLMPLVLLMLKPHFLSSQLIL